MDVGVMIQDLNQEITKLTAARDALVNVQNGDGPAAPARTSAPVASPPAAPATATKPKPRGRPSGTGGETRADEAFRLVQANPGIAIPELAKKMKIEPNYLYRVMPKLKDEGRVRNENGGWHPSVS